MRPWLSRAFAPRLRHVAMLLVVLFVAGMARALGAPALSFVFPPDGGIVHDRSFGMAVSASGYQPAYVVFYHTIGTFDIPFDVAVRGSDGLYHSGFSADDDGYVYLGARDSDSLASVDAHIGVDTRVPPATLSFAPADGATVRSTTVTLTSVPTGFNPKYVEFYQGDPSDSIIDMYLGRASKNSDGSYSRPVTFQNGYHTLYAKYSNDLYTVQSPLSTVAVDTRTGPTSITISAPGNGSTVTSQQVTIKASAVNYVPDGLDVYGKAPGGATIDMYLGKAAPQPDGSYALPANFGVGLHTIYAEASDGFGMVVSPTITFSVNTATGPLALSVVDPPNGTTVRSRSVTLRAVSTNFQPSSVTFYAGDPTDGIIDQTLGSAQRAPDGSYSLPVDFTSDGAVQVYAQASYGSQTVTTPLDTFTVDTRTGPTSLAITNPLTGSTTVTRDVVLRAQPVNYKPSGGVSFYEGDPSGGAITAYLGNGTLDADGQYSLPITFSVGSHTIYATSNDGFSDLSSPLVTFGVGNGAPVSLAVTSPANGGTVTSHNVSLVAAATNYQPSSVGFYSKDPTGQTIDSYLGSVSRGTDGNYSLPATFPDGVAEVYAVANNGQAVETSPLVTFTVNTGVANATLSITNPVAGSTQTSSYVDLVSVAGSFQPGSVSYYETDGSGTIDAFLGSASRGTDGSYTKPGLYFADGSHTIYATAANGSATVRSANVTFSVSTKVSISSLNLSANSVAACGTAIGTVTLNRAAPTGGAVVNLSSSNAALTVPANVTVPAGQTAASFPITTETGRNTVPVTVTATYDNSTATASITVTPYAHVPYTIEDLGAMGGTESYAFGINASGQVTGVTYLSSGQAKAFVTDANGVMTDVAPAVTDSIYGYAINDKGQVTGYQEHADGSGVAFRTSPSGAYATLPTLGGTKTFGFSINNLGQVTGYGILADGSEHAFRVDADSSIHDLGVLSGMTDSYGYGINDSGQVTGFSSTSAGAAAFETTANGNVSSAQAIGQYGAYAYAMNKSGAITGEYFPSSSSATSHLFRGTSTGALTDLGTLGSYFTAGEGINTAGDIVGETYSVNNSQAVVYHAFRCLSGGSVEDLNSLIDTASGWVLQSATGINDRGQIVGYGTHSGTTHAFRLTPNGAPFPYGDANGDGAVDQKDVLLLLRAAGGLATVPNLLAGDVAPSPLCTTRGFGDGRITVQDAMRVLRDIHGLEPVWP